MATTPKQQTAETQATESIEQRFRRLEAIWEADTLYLSNARKIIEHPAFQEIISLGEAVIPLMLRDLQKEPSEWVWALPRITGVNPVSPADGGNFRKMAEVWLKWGRENGYQW
jgi:hypothetical protein